MARTYKGHEKVDFLNINKFQLYDSNNYFLDCINSPVPILRQRITLL